MTGRRKTMPLAKESRAAIRAVREARAKGESTAAALFETLSPQEQAAYLRTHL